LWNSLAIILAEQDPAVAHKFSQEAADRRMGVVDDLYPPLFLRLFGSRKEGEEAAQNLRKLNPRWPWRNGWYDKRLRFQCGEISADDLVKAAGTSQWNLLDANFDVAMTFLAGAYREEAKKHFQAVIDTGLFNFGNYICSVLILTRMNQDPTWPKWIPLTDQATTRPGGSEGK
jgi:hypothetical protein